MKLTKKGVSPIISAVILISFAVGMGAVLISWGNKFFVEQAGTVTDTTERAIECSLDLQIDVLEIGDSKYICYNRTGSNNLEIIVENTGGGSAEGLQVFTLDASDMPYTFNELDSLGAHNRTKYNVSLGGSYAFPPTKIILAPILKVEGSKISVCSNNKIEIDDIDQCE